MTDNQGAPPVRPPEITFADIVRALWKTLREMRSVLYLLLVLAIACLMGTVLPQKQPPEYYTDRYGPLLGNLIVALGFQRIFTSAWFILLVFLLMISLVACSRRLWLQAAGRWRVPDPATLGRRFAAAHTLVTARASLPVDQAQARLLRAARRRGLAAHSLSQEHGSRLIHLTKHRWAAWGTVLTHYALFLIGIGAVLGTLPGISVDTQIRVVEGHETDTAEAEGDGSQGTKLPFSVRLNNFEMRYDEGTGALENYYSDLSIIHNGEEAVRQTISVNRPLQYKGYYLSQASWGVSGAVFEITAGGKTQTVEFPLEPVACPGQTGESEACVWQFRQPGSAVFLEGDEVALVATEFLANAVVEPGQNVGQQVEGNEKQGQDKGTTSSVRPSQLADAGSPAGSSTDGGEAVASRQRRIVDAGGDRIEHPGVRLLSVSGFHGGQHKLKELGVVLLGESVDIPGGRATFKSVAEWSGIGVRKDPGVGLVWLGFIGAVLGMMMHFYFRRQSASVKLEPIGRGETQLVMIGAPGPESDSLPPSLWHDLLAEVGGTTQTSPAETRKGTGQ